MERIDSLERRISELESYRSSMQSALTENTRISTQTRDNTTELLEWFRDYKSSLRVLGRVGWFLKWAAGFAAATATVWSLMKGWK